MPADVTVVIDANVAIGLAAASRLEAFAQSRRLVAPPLFWSETRSALHAEGMRSDAEDSCVDIFRAIVAAPILQVEHETMAGPWVRASIHGWQKTYDAEYLSLALELDAELATIDRRLRRAAEADGVVLTPIA